MNYTRPALPSKNLKAMGCLSFTSRPKSVCVPAIETLRRAREILTQVPAQCHTAGSDARDPALELGETGLWRYRAGFEDRGVAGPEFKGHGARNRRHVGRALSVQQQQSIRDQHRCLRRGPCAGLPGRSPARRYGDGTVRAFTIEQPVPEHPFFPRVLAPPYMNSRGEIVEGNVMQHLAISIRINWHRSFTAKSRRATVPYTLTDANCRRRTKELPSNAGPKEKTHQTLDINKFHYKIEIVIGSHFNAGGVSINPRAETTIQLVCRRRGNRQHRWRPETRWNQLYADIVFGIVSGKQAACFARKNRRTSGTVLRGREAGAGSPRTLSIRQNRVRLVDLRRQL